MRPQQLSFILCYGPMCKPLHQLLLIKVTINLPAQTEDKSQKWDLGKRNLSEF